MAEQELKEKIVKTITNLNNICRKGCVCKYCKYENYDNCTEYAIANALITAGIGDVSELQFDNEVLKMRNFFLEGSERSTEEDRQVWINKWKEAEHRAEIAERMLKLCENAYLLTINGMNPNAFLLKGITSDLVIHEFLRQQVEEELAEEKDEQA